MRVCPHLLSEQNFDCQLSGSGGNVLDGERVVGIGDDVKVHVSLLVTDHVGVALDAHTDVTLVDKNTHAIAS